MNHQLQNQRALVTGGSRGIGAAIVKRLAREGAHVALTYVSKPDQANETTKAARALGVQAIAIQADNADAKAVVAAVERTVQELGGIDILVNNAGKDYTCGSSLYSPPAKGGCPKGGGVSPQGRTTPALRATPP
jgi:3-oxoacyl-[acyl-carrier protein] reductase